MKSNLFFAIGLLCLVSCVKKEERGKEGSCSKGAGEKSFKMYQMSEMAILMEQMYVDNQRLRSRILTGDTIGHYPDYFNRIRQATMTDPADRDLFFQEHAERFLKAQQLIYEDSAHAKQRFNEAVARCLQCHETKCGGPIGKIKKLYIK